MKKALAAIALAAALGIGAFAVAAVAPAGAAVNATTASANRHPQARELIRKAAQVAADAIGVPVAELRADVAGGQSVADVATAHGVDPATVQQDLVNAATAKVHELLDAGKISQRRADRLLARLPRLAERFVQHHRG